MEKAPSDKSAEQLYGSGIKELFPSYVEGEDISERLIELASFSNEIDVPFPAEPNRQYAVWWRSLHEVAHWAVKPHWYTDTEIGGREIPVLKTIIYLPEIGPRTITYYNAGNDIIPDAELMDDTDPTPHEREVQPWALRLMRLKGWQHPFAEILEQGQSYFDVSKLKDEGWHKPASMRIWSPTKQFNPEAVRTMAYFGIDPLRGKFRAQDKNFAVPYPGPTTFDEIKTNRLEISRAYQDKAEWFLPANTPEDTKIVDLYHDTFLEWESQTQDGKFGSELQAKLLQQFRKVEDYSFQRFEEMTEEILRG